jgi:hypothetical protein
MLEIHVVWLKIVELCVRVPHIGEQNLPKAHPSHCECWPWKLSCQKRGMPVIQRNIVRHHEPKGMRAELANPFNVNTHMRTAHCEDFFQQKKPPKHKKSGEFFTEQVTHIQNAEKLKHFLDSRRN